MSEPPGAQPLHEPKTLGPDAALLVVTVWALLHLANFLGTTIHELVGHGLTALALGGTFTGFEVGFASGFSYSSVPEGAPRWHEVLQLAAGNLSHFLPGLLLIGLERLGRVEKKGELRLGLLTIGTIWVVGACHSFFAGLDSETSDAARIVVLSGGSWVPVAFFRASGLGLFAFPIYLFVRLPRVLGLFESVATVRQRTVLLVGSLGTAPAVAVYLVPRLPGPADWHESIATVLVVALNGMLVLVARRDPHVAPPTERLGRRFAIGALALALGSGLVTGLWLSRGVHWGS